VLLKDSAADPSVTRPTVVAMRIKYACTVYGAVSDERRCPEHRTPKAPARRPRLDAGWRKLRVTILERDGHACQFRDGDGICVRPATTVDHIVPVSHGGTDDPSNLRAACVPHNLGHHNRAPAYRDPAEPRPKPSRHPPYLP
jgi:5-methylcytosine-specific restriction endonuclease McrA